MAKREPSPEAWTKLLKKSYKESTPKIRTRNGRIPYWWTDGIAEHRRTVTKARRKVLRLHRQARGDDDQVASALETYKSAKKQLVIMINASKRACWSKLCQEVDSDPYGELFGSRCPRYF